MVTGAASGIGLATATKLARSGASVAINDLCTNEKLIIEVAKLRGEGLDVHSVPEMSANQTRRHKLSLLPLKCSAASDQQRRSARYEIANLCR
ncbi:SDR family NAD(P)-dependent oxidoreductase [Mesorhizobium sp. M0622]|uniref:SDR family NAD(P)-dependent oxidoreductase n=1 Tax=Mesorhizobium sp. M0622 TaxID=2956975 RepID=UPI0033376418